MTAADPIDQLVGDLAAASTRWLPPSASPATTLPDAVERAAPCWPDAWDDIGAADDLLLFPLLYAGRLRVTTATFHHLVDAGCEAIRGGASVALVPVPTGRAGTQANAHEAVQAIADAATAAGFPVRAVDELAVHPLFGPAMLARACATPYTRRLLDLPDLVVAAAADTLGTNWVYLTKGVLPGRHLQRMHCCPPLSRLHDPADPFAAPPAGAKRPPAGTDAVWACGFTLGLTDTATTSPNDWAAMRDAVRSRVAPLWKDLLRRQVVSRCATPSPGGAAQLRIKGHRRRDPVIVPLLGSPGVADGTRALIRAASIAGPVTIVVDDLTPRFSYPDYPADAARATYQRLAADHHGTAEFLTDVPDLSERLDKTLQTLTIADAAIAAGTRHHRRRGQLTGYDAVHLAVMAVCAAMRPETVAVKSANLPAMQALARVLPTRRVLAFSGPAQPTPADWRNLPLPAEWLDPPS